MTSEPHNREDRRAQLLEVALELFAQKGYHATSIADIIDAASVARGTFYNYFENKRRIFGELLDSLFETMISAVFVIDTNSDEPVRDQVRRLIRAVCTRMSENFPMARVIIDQAVGLDAQTNAQLQDFYGRVFAHLKKSLEDGQVMGIVRQGNTTVLATCMLGMVKESVYLRILGICDPKLEDVVDEIFDVAARGILVQPD